MANNTTRWEGMFLLGVYRRAGTGPRPSSCPPTKQTLAFASPFCRSGSRVSEVTRGLEAALTSCAYDGLCAVHFFLARGEARRSLSYRPLNLVLKGGGGVDCTRKMGRAVSGAEGWAGSWPEWSGNLPGRREAGAGLEGWMAGGGQNMSLRGGWGEGLRMGPRQRKPAFSGS